MYNSQMFKIQEIDKEGVKVEGERFTMKEFKRNFTLAYAVTVYKYQGDDIDENYCIWDIEKMDKKMVYTAISRTTKWEYVHVAKALSNKRYSNREYKHKTLKTYVTEYSKGKIYKITFDEGKIYIGQTCKELSERLKEHINDKRSPIFGYKEAKIELECYHPCETLKELEECEKKYINKYPECVNKRSNDKWKGQKKKVVKASYTIIHDESIKEKLRETRFKIYECSDRYRIKNATKDGKPLNKGFKRNKEEAYEKIKVEQERLINEYLDNS